MNRRKLITIFIILSVLVLAIFAFFNFLYYGTVELTVKGEHNPISNSIYINDSKIYPQGNGGNKYVAKVRPGKAKVSIYGPQIKSIITETDVNLNEAKIIELETSKVPLPESVAEISGVENAKYFGSGNIWLIFTRKLSEDDLTTEQCVYKFSEISWNKIVCSEKIDANSVTFRGAPSELLNYISEVSGD